MTGAGRFGRVGEIFDHLILEIPLCLDLRPFLQVREFDREIKRLVWSIGICYFSGLEIFVQRFGRNNTVNGRRAGISN